MVFLLYSAASAMDGLNNILCDYHIKHMYYIVMRRTIQPVEYHRNNVYRCSLESEFS